MRTFTFFSILGLSLVLCMRVLSSQESASKGPMIEPTQFEHIDGIVACAGYIDIKLESKDRLFYRYSPIADSGVELELVRAGKVVWRTHVQPLGVEHSKYTHSVKVTVDGFDPTKLNVVSIGEKVIYETRNLVDGREITRGIRTLSN